MNACTLITAIIEYMWYIPITGMKARRGSRRYHVALQDDEHKIYNPYTPTRDAESNTNRQHHTCKEYLEKPFDKRWLLLLCFHSRVRPSVITYGSRIDLGWSRATCMGNRWSALPHPSARLQWILEFQLPTSALAAKKTRKSVECWNNWWWRKYQRT